MLTGLWLSPSQYRVTDAERGKSKVITILGTREDFEDQVYILELEHMARESVKEDWVKEEAEQKRPYTVTERRDLGSTLKDFKDFKQRQRENGNGRLW
jgi:hypothetical protein